MLPIAVLVASILIVGIYPAVISDVFKTGVEEIIRPFVGTQVLELK
jgi:NADH:ubiquinone oxidoreductase subunit 4 (subunit M)